MNLPTVCSNQGYVTQEKFSLVTASRSCSPSSIDQLDVEVHKLPYSAKFY